MPARHLTRAQHLKKQRHYRWLARSAHGNAVVDVEITPQHVAEMIAMGYLAADESEDKAEIARALLTEHGDLVALHRKEIDASKD